MIIMSWNCRGMGQPRAVNVLDELIKTHRPGIVILLETFANKSRMETVRSKVKMEGCFAVDADGHSGGVCVLWREREEVTVKGFGRNLIIMEVKENGINPFILTAYYGYSQRHRRKAAWDLLRAIARPGDEAWCCMGDFNDLLHQDEKRGMRDHPQELMDGFRQAVNDCGLVDIPLEGYPFTWVRSKGSANCIEERLDRAMVNEEWMQTFPNAVLRNLIAPVSDHSPILLNTRPCEIRRQVRRFRFENKWFEEHSLKPLVTNKWEELEGLALENRLNECAVELGRWGKEISVQFHRRKRELDQRLEELRERSDSEAGDEWRACREEKLILLQQEDTYWKQRAKQYFLQFGDMNTKYFHAVANGRRSKKVMKGILDATGTWKENIDDMARVVQSYFLDLFRGDECEWQEVVGCVERRVTEADNRLLLAPFTDEEIREAMFSMNPDKAPGPDGFNPGFYQKFWHLVGSHVTSSCKEWMMKGELPQFVQNTTIVLLPKGDRPQTMKEWRPISLCNVLYRLVAKVLANRLRRVMPALVAEEQAAFVRGRSIVDNILIAFETLHSMKLRRRAKHGEVAIKIDISKAYDRVDWRYLEEILKKLGFEARWVRLMMMCVKSVEYRVAVNDVMVGPINPERGLRQGCPLSPFLFVLCTEGLSALMQREKEEERIHGSRVSRRAPAVSHLLFADDSFFFCRAEIPEVRRLKEIFQLYEKASGQSINYLKSGIYFSPNTNAMLQDGIRYIMGIQASLDTGRYLGMPSMVGRNKKAVFNYLKERVWKRIQSWRGKPLSNGGKEILIKAVAQALPVYCMNVFLLPITLLEEIEKMINSFWWGTKGVGGGGVSWMRWERMCVRKEHGGLGFKDLYGFNLAMLGKQGWQLFTNPTTLVYKILKAKYFPHGNFLSAALGSNPSVTWRSIVEARLAVLQGYRWKVGDGSQIKVWEDPWIRREGSFIVESTSPIPDWDLRVSALLQPSGDAWDEDRVRGLFHPRESDEILAMVVVGGERDMPVWHYSKYGEYTVRSAYRLLLERVGDMETLRCDGEWRKLWALKLPPKIKHFAWRAGRDVLPTRRRLQERHIMVQGECGICSADMENAWHLFLSCDFATACWEEARLREWVVHIKGRSESFVQWLMIVLQEADETRCNLTLAILWAVWRERNARVWKSSAQIASRVVEMAKETVAEWKEAQQRRGGQERIPMRSECQRWHPPPENAMKCNVDAAWFLDRGEVGLGACLRDANGELMSYMTIRRRGNNCSKENEAMAVWEGMKWCVNLELDCVIFESDAQSVVEAIGREQCEDRREFGDIIRRCHSIIRSKPGYSVRFVRRDCNQVAHVLAQQSRFLGSPTVGETSPHFLSSLLNDVCWITHD
ncbi:Transposon TX1 uncharacterized 149 kDa protein [Linum grandiflorum]